MKTKALAWPAALLAAIVAVAEVPSRAEESFEREFISGVLVSDEDGGALPGASVWLCRRMEQDVFLERFGSGIVEPEIISSSVTDAEGRYSLEVLEPGAFFLAAEAEGHARVRLTPILSASPGRSLGELRLPKGRRLGGRLVGPGGEPLAGAGVVLYDARISSQDPRPGQPVPMPVIARTGESGDFVLDHLVTRPLPVIVLAPGMAFVPAGIDKSDDGASTIHAQPGVRIEGRVVGPDRATPVPGAVVYAEQRGQPIIGRTDTQGRYSIGVLEPGLEVSLVAALHSSMHGMLAPSAKLSVAPGESAGGQELRLREGCEIRARIFDRSHREPLAGVSLHAYSLGSTTLNTTVTGPDGTARLSGLLPGKVILVTQADGFVDERLQDLPVDAGESRQVTLLLQQSASLTGRVRDTEDRPVEDVDLSLAEDVGFGLYNALLPSPNEKVGPDGAFEISPLPPGKVLVLRAQAADYAPQEMHLEPFEAGERRSGLEIVLDPGSAISGRVTDIRGEPVGGAEVLADAVVQGMFGSSELDRNSLKASRFIRPGSRTLLPVKTDSEGRFTVRGARPGSWELLIVAEGFAPRNHRGITVEPAGAETNVGDLTLEPGARVRGRVVTPDGSPLPDWTFLHLQDPDRTLGGYMSMKMQEDGSFESEDLPSGEPLILSAEVEGYLPWRSGLLRPPVHDLVVHLERGARISGQVTDATDGKPLASYFVEVSYPDLPQSHTGGRSGPTELVQDADGAFSLDGVKPGRIVLEVRVDGYSSTSREYLVPESGELSGLSISLEPAQRLSGVVLDEQGSGIQGAAVQQVRPASPGLGISDLEQRGLPHRTDAEGRFSFTVQEPGPWTLSIEHPDYRRQDIHVEPGVGQDTVIVRMGRGESVAGRVVRRTDGRPIPGARISVFAGTGFTPDPGPFSPVVTGPEGRFTVGGLSPGRHTILARVEGFVAGSCQDVLVTESGPAPSCEIALGPEGRLVGRILGWDDADITDFSVSVADRPFAMHGAQAPIDSTGRFTLENLTPGPNELMLHSGGGSTLRPGWRVDVPDDGESLEATFQWPERGITVSGRVTQDGQPVSGASITFMRTVDNLVLNVRSDTDGMYEVSGLPPGEHMIGVGRSFLSIIPLLRREVITADRTLDIDLPDGTIRGRVLSRETGKPLPGAVISIQRSGPDAEPEEVGLSLLMPDVADDQGRFVRSGMLPGPYRATAQAEGHGFETKPVSVGDDGVPVEVTFHLEPVEPFVFRIEDPLGRPEARSLEVAILLEHAAGATVESPEAVFFGRLRPDSSGLYRLQSLRSGLYRIVIKSDGLAIEQRDHVRVPGPETTFFLSQGGVLRIEVASPSPGRVRLRLLDENKRTVPLDMGLMDGWLEMPSGQSVLLPEVRGGVYTLQATWPDGSTVEKSVTLRAGQTEQLTIP